MGLERQQKLGLMRKNKKILLDFATLNNFLKEFKKQLDILACS